MLQNKLPHIIRFTHNWVKPEGFNTGIKIYNCITKQKEPLIVRNKNLVSWYTCGPTVYDEAHIGHFCCFLKLDIIQRLLRNYFNLNVVTIMNITDVDDKIIAKSNEIKVPPNQLTKKYETNFWRDFDTFGLIKPDHILRVTENIKSICDFISHLLNKQAAYRAANGTIYFDVTQYSRYGKLHPTEPLQEVPFKKSSMDFALWKPAKPGEVFWNSPWGDGRPGWHIECSALASQVFGNEIDFHAGGVDLKFPHHENEEAQSCSYYGKPQWVNYWVHTGHLHVKNSEKMSKSLQNTISVSSLLETTSPQIFRMACLMSHYRRNFEFSPEFLQTAATTLANYNNFIDNCKNCMKGIIAAQIDPQLLQESASKIHEALIDDFNTPKVVQTLNEIVSNVVFANEKNDSVLVVMGILNLFVRVLDLVGLGVERQKGRDFSEIMDVLNEFRQKVRVSAISKKDMEMLNLCDDLREELKIRGVVIKDHGKMSTWS